MTEGTVARRTALKAGAAGLALAVAPRWARAETKFDVVILGAGISGLHAARMLQTNGMKVLVLEGSSRIGGRCWTARDVVGRPELGAVQIGHSYGRVRGNAAELGVELVNPLAGALAETALPQFAISLRGAPVSSEPWATSPINQLADDEKKLSPLQLYSYYIAKNNQLAGLDDWLRPEFASLDRLSLRQHFTQLGASAEALRLIDVTIPARDLDDANALDFIRKNYYYHWDAKGGTYSVVRDGTSTLTDAMAASLTEPVRTGKVVTRIKAGARDIEVHCADGSVHVARTCISTIPLSVMKDIVVDGPVPDAQRAAWRSMRYVQLVMVYLRIATPFWEKDGAPKSMWSDGPIELIFHLPSRTEANGMLLVYVNGAGTVPLNRMSPEALGAYVVAELVRIRPAAAGQVSVAHIHNWSTYPFSKGHVAYYAPGDIGRYAKIVAQPVGALFFAGEHCGKLNAGMEAACEAAEAAVLQALDAMDTA